MSSVIATFYGLHLFIALVNSSMVKGADSLVVLLSSILLILILCLEGIWSGLPFLMVWVATWSALRWHRLSSGLGRYLGSSTVSMLWGCLCSYGARPLVLPNSLFLVLRYGVNYNNYLFASIVSYPTGFVSTNFPYELRMGTWHIIGQCWVKFLFYKIYIYTLQSHPNKNFDWRQISNSRHFSGTKRHIGNFVKLYL